VTWTTLRDSAVSGTYVETSAGLTFTPTGNTTSYKATMAVWDKVANAYVSAISHTSSTVAHLSITKTTAENIIDDNGKMNVIVYSEPSLSTTANGKIEGDYVSITLVGSVRYETRLYENDRILRFNSVEEINVLNDSLPSDELTITLDNSAGRIRLFNLYQHAANSGY
jgi:hypothetical protein